MKTPSREYPSRRWLDLKLSRPTILEQAAERWSGGEREKGEKKESSHLGRQTKAYARDADARQGCVVAARVFTRVESQEGAAGRHALR